MPSLQSKQKRCVFCDSIEIRAREIAGNDLAFSFPTNIPITPGHTLIAPRRCVGALADLSEEERLAVYALAEIIMSALRGSFGAEGFNCAWNEGKLAGQSVPHFHLHVIPRKEGDTGLLGYDPRSMIYRTGDRDPTSEEELTRIADEIKKHLPDK